MNVRAPRSVQFECQRCARCCGDTSHRGRIIYMLNDEVEKISELTGLRPMEFSSPISGLKNYKFKMKKRNGICVFLKDHACRIYDGRPLLCNIYPFLVRKSNGSFLFDISEDCPGIGLGYSIQDNYFKKMAESARGIFD